MTLGQRVAVLKDGVLQQVDTPQNLYMHPANLFVGGVHRLAAHEPGRGDGVGSGRVAFAGYDIALPDGATCPRIRARP